MSTIKRIILTCSVFVFLIVCIGSLLIMNGDAFLNWLYDEDKADEMAGRWADIGADSTLIWNTVNARLGLTILQISEGSPGD